MTGPGPVALHGGGEFLPGDEPFLEALLVAAAPLVDDGEPIRIAIVPTAGANGRPGIVAAHGVAAFERVARRAGRPVGPNRSSSSTPGPRPIQTLADRLERRTSSTSRVATRRSSRSRSAARRPGPRSVGAPSGRGAGRRQRRCHGDGAVHVDAEWRVPGLAVVPGLVVAPHAEPATWSRVLAQYGDMLTAGHRVARDRGTNRRDGLGRRAVAGRRGGRGPLAPAGCDRADRRAVRRPHRRPQAGARQLTFRRVGRASRA